MGRLQRLVRELRRRRVFRAAGIYVVASWVALQVASLIFPAIDVPDAAIRYVWLIAILVFPLVIFFAWFYEVTPSGLERTPPAQGTTEVDSSLRRFDYVILAALFLVGTAIAWQFAGDIRDATSNSRIETAGGDPDPHSIAVLPLANLSGDPQQLFFVSGMQDALISGLSRIRELKVTSKTSTMRFAETTEPLPQIAAQLGVANLIEGSVFRVGDKVRISVQLVDAVEDRHIWSDSYEEDVRDVLKLQRKVAEAIADQIQVVVADFEVVKTVDPEAYDAFLKGQFHVERFTPQDMALAAQYYQQAVDLDADNALAHYGLSKLCAFQAQVGLISPEQARDQCWPHIERALELEPTLPQAHMGYAGHMTWQRFDWNEAERGFRQAIELNPSYAEARMFYSHYLAIVGRLEESTEQIELARELDPLNPFVQGMHGGQRWLIGDPPGAVEIIEATMADAPGFGFGYDILWPAHHEAEREDEAMVALSGLLMTQGADHLGIRTYNASLAKGGYREAMAETARVLSENFESSPVMPTTIAMLYEFSGQIELALDWYEKSYQMGSPDAPYMGPAMGSSLVHNEPRFIAVLQKLKLNYWAEKYSQNRITN